MNDKTTKAQQHLLERLARSRGGCATAQDLRARWNTHQALLEMGYLTRNVESYSFGLTITQAGRDYLATLELMKVAKTVMTNLEFVWRKKHGNVMPVQEFRTNSDRSDEVIARSYQLLVNCFNGRGNR